MSTAKSNGVIRIGRKGVKKFAFGDGEPFDVDIVVAFQEWIGIDDEFRPAEPDADGRRPIPTAEMPRYHAEAAAYVSRLSNVDVTAAEALDFIARLREQYDELAVFFQPKSLVERDSQSSSEPVSELRFSEEPTTN